MLDKIKNPLQNQNWRQSMNLRHLSTAGFALIAILITWSGVKVIGTNYDLQKQISKMQQENEVQQLENNNLKLQNEYLNADQYLELSAREHFDKAAPGETLVIVPNSVALKHTVDLPKTAATATKTTESAQPWYERNFNAWLDFFFHRES
jgi:cell division protein FtsB